jgi:hypothetical protein
MAVNRQLDAAACSGAKGGADMSFQTLQRGADVRLLLVNGARRGANATPPGDLVKDLEQVPVDIMGKDDAWFQDQIRLTHRCNPCL